MSKLKIACHLITWRGEQWKNLEKVLRVVHEAGYDGAEGIRIDSSQSLIDSAILAAHYNLHLVNVSHSPPENRRESVEKSFKYNITLGNNAVEIPPCRRAEYGGQNPKNEDYKRAAETIQSLCDIAKYYNVKPIHHMHLNTILETAEDADMLLKYSNDIYLLLDTGHILASNSDPLKVLRSHSDRIGLVHLKDVKAINPKTWNRWRDKWKTDAWFEELGQGNLGFNIKEFLEELESTGYSGWVTVEQDFPTNHDPEETVKINREYLKNIGF